MYITAFRFGFEQSSYSVIESDEEVSVCVTGDRGDGSEMYTLSLTSINVTTQGIAYMVLEHCKYCSSYLYKTLAP